MMIQKGFVIAPVLVWVLLTVSGLFVGTVAVKKGLISVDLSGVQSQGEVKSATTDTTILENLQFPISEPEITPTPTPTLDSDPIVDCPFPHSGVRKMRSSECSRATDCEINGKWYPYTSKEKCTQDQNIGGSRTGSIIKYKEFCKAGQEISIYQNELITKKASDGSTYSMTQKDWGCFENSLKNKPGQAIDTTNNKPVGVSTITCVLPYGKYQIPQADCDNIKGILGSTESIKRNFEEENKRILEESSQKLNEIKNRTYQPSYTTPTFPTPAPLPQLQQIPFDAFDTGRMCTRKAINNTTTGGGIIFIGECI